MICDPSERSQCVQVDAHLRLVERLQWRTPGVCFRPTVIFCLFSSLGQNVDGVSFHFYADDIVTYCAGSSLKLRLKLEFYFRNKSCFSFEA